MAETVYKQRVAKKQSSETKPQESSAESSSQVSPRPIFAEALFIREFQRMSAENKRLREENEELSAHVKERRRKESERKAKWRQDNPEKAKQIHNKAMKKYMQKRRAREKQQSESPEPNDTTRGT